MRWRWRPALVAGLALVAVAAARADLPAAIYPAPHPALHRGAYVDLCPSLRGVALPGRGSGRAVVRTLSIFNGNFRHDRRYADRAIWPRLRTGSLRFPRAAVLVDTARAAGDAHAGIARHACGRRIVRRSWSVLQDFPNSASLDTTYYFLKRQGHWLLWFAY
jgi:hypothetical protein